jgi:hypothetical protein
MRYWHLVSPFFRYYATFAMCPFLMVITVLSGAVSRDFGQLVWLFVTIPGFLFAIVYVIWFVRCPGCRRRLESMRFMSKGMSLGWIGFNCPNCGTDLTKLS